MLVASPQTGFKTVKDIVDAKRPIKYATTGVGTGSQLSQQLLFAQAERQRHRGAVQRRRAGADRGARRPGRRRLRAARRGAGPDQGQARSTPIVTFADKRPTYMPDTPTAIEAGLQRAGAAVAGDRGARRAPRRRSSTGCARRSRSRSRSRSTRTSTPSACSPRTRSTAPTLLQQWTGSLTDLPRAGRAVQDQLERQVT